MHAKLLDDRNRLQEIYDLRVEAYEASPYSRHVYRERYPEGYSDYLDPLGITYHWIVEDNERIVGSVRASIIKDRSVLCEDLTQLVLPDKLPFAYCGRTVVHPNYRSGRMMLKLDHVIREFIRATSSIEFALCLVMPERVRAVKRLGFRKIGSINYDWGKGDTTLLEAFIFEKGQE